MAWSSRTPSNLLTAAFTPASLPRTKICRRGHLSLEPIFALSAATRSTMPRTRDMLCSSSSSMRLWSHFGQSSMCTVRSLPPMCW